MGKINIFCNNCGTTWTVLHRDDWKDWKYRVCPCCGKEIDSHSWESVVTAFHEYEEAQKEIIQDAQQPNGTLFRVSFEYNVNVKQYSQEGRWMNE